MVLQAFQDGLATGQGLTTPIPCRGHQHNGLTHRHRTHPVTHQGRYRTVWSTSFPCEADI